MPNQKMSIEEAYQALERNRREMTSETIKKTIAAVNEGKPDAEQVKALLTEFCLRARDIRSCMNPITSTPSIVEFVASRLMLYLNGEENSIEQALGLKSPGRGRRRSNWAHAKGVVVAAEILELMDEGTTLDEASAQVASKRYIHQSTAKNHYTNNKSDAKMVLMCRELDVRFRKSP